MMDGFYHILQKHGTDLAKAEIFYRTFGLVKSNISPDRIKICRTEKFLVEYLQIKVKIVLFLHLFALANTIILHYAFSSLKKLLARFVSLLLFWQKKYEMPLYA